MSQSRATLQPTTRTVLAALPEEWATAKQVTGRLVPGDNLDPERVPPLLRVLRRKGLARQNGADQFQRTPTGTALSRSLESC